jgi:DNA-3-methyladenine glycosylase II
MQTEQIPVATTQFSLEPVTPFRLDLTVWVLKRRPDYIVDQWDGETYQRTLLVDELPLGIAVRQPEPARLEVTLSGPEAAVTRRDVVQPIIERLLGTNVDLSDYYAFADDDEQLRPLVRRFAGFKPPRYPTLFECLTNAIACQ